MSYAELLARMVEAVIIEFCFLNSIKVMIIHDIVKIDVLGNHATLVFFN